MKAISLPVFGITVSVCEQDASGEITSDLHDENASPEYQAAIDALTSLILAHACAGIDVECPAYLEGIETAVEAIANNFGD